MSPEIRDVAVAGLRFSALCFACRPNGGRVVETGIDNLCPHCGGETAPESREYRRQARVLATVAADVPAPETGGAATIDPIVLPASAASWYGSTQALADQLDAEEIAAAEALRAAQERLRQARRAKAALGQVLAAFAVTPQPTPKAGAAVPAKKATSARTWPVKVGVGMVVACTRCGTTEQPPFAYGRCEPCHRAKRDGAQ